MTVLPTQIAPPAPGQQLPRWADLKAIGDAQRLVLLTLLVGLLAIPLLAALGGGLGASGVDPRALGAGAILLVVLVLAVRIWMAIAVYRLAKALGSRIGVLWSLGTFLPSLLGLLVLVAISARATSRLKKAGLKVGLLGAKLPDRPPPGFLCEEVAGAFS